MDSEKQKSYAKSAEDFPALQQRAAEAGLLLRKCSDVHYQIKSVMDEWLINVYPGNRRLYWDRNRPKAPYLRGVPEDWTLEDVVNSAIRQAD